MPPPLNLAQFKTSGSKPSTGGLDLSLFKGINVNPAIPQTKAPQKSNAYNPSVDNISDVAATGKDLIDQTKSHAANIVDALSQSPSFSGAADVAGNVAGEAGDLITGLLKFGAQVTVPKPLRSAISSMVSSLVANHAQQTANGQQPQDKIGQELDKFQAQHPNLYKSIVGIGSAVSLDALPDADLGDIGATAKQGAGAAADMMKSPISAIADIGKPSVADTLDNLTDKIAPNMNTAETRTALNEGRITRSSQGSISKALFGQAPDTVQQSDEVLQAANTIRNNIPGAAKMDDAQLYSALDKGVAAKAQAIRPALEATPVNVKTLGGIQDAWATTKASQAEDVGFANMPGSKVAQTKFQNIVDDLNLGSKDPVTGKFLSAKTPTVADIWDARINYDASIPANVKNATDLSSESLQYQKTMWLQNRSILNDAIHESVGGLDTESQQAFSEMSDMYTAKQNILTKVEKPAESGAGIMGKGGKFSLKRVGVNAAGAAATAWIGGSILKKVGVLP